MKAGCTWVSAADLPVGAEVLVDPHRRSRTASETLRANADLLVGQHCANVGDDVELRSGQLIPLCVREELRQARAAWVMMQRVPYRHDSSEQSSDLMECIQKIISLPLVQMRERAGLQPSPLSRLRMLFIRALTAKLHEDLSFTKELREKTLSSIQASLSWDMQEKLKRCWSCEKVLLKPARCTRCKVASYCDETCQKNDWQTHRKRCEKMSRAKRKPTADDVCRALGTTNTQLHPFIVHLDQNWDWQLGVCTAGYLGYDVRMFFKSRRAIVFIAYPDVKAATARCEKALCSWSRSTEPFKINYSSLFWEPFESGARETTGKRLEQATTRKRLEIMETESELEQLECCLCGGPPNLLNAKTECLHFFCNECISSLRLRGKCKQCGCKLETLIMLSKKNEEG